MRIRNRSKVSTVAFVLMFTVTVLMAGILPASAHDPPMSFKTFAYITCAPPTIGVGQQMLIYTWLDKVPPTATGPWGDRWEDLTVEVTKPDGSKQTLGPVDSDPIGFAVLPYTPDQTGTYTFQMSFPGQTLEGKNLAPPPWPGGPVYGEEFIGDYFEPSTSGVATLTVQEEPIEPFPTTPLPTDYWTRPIDAQYRDWWSISGNWPATPPNNFARYTKGPETSHIMWAKPLTFGGLVGGEFGSHAYHCGNAYEGKWWPPVIIGGVLYYNQFPSSMAYAEMGFAGYNMPGVHAVDLRTGEEIWYNPDMRIDFGQIYYYSSINQHGAAPYLWQAEGNTWLCYDAWTGQWFCNVTNLPPGVTGLFGPTFAFGPNGEIMQPVLGPTGPPGTPLSWLALWNLNAIPELTGAADIPGAPLNGTAGLMWRPFNKVVDGANGYVWNVTLPPEVTRGSIAGILSDEDGNLDRIVGSWVNTTGFGFGAVPIGDYEVWCLSLKKGEEGKLLWKTEIARPPGATLNIGGFAGLPSSLEDGVFAVWCPHTRQWWGYSLDNGNLLWGPTEPQADWDFTVATAGNIAYGQLFSMGMGGILYCYDATTGTLLWTYDLECPYYLESKWGGYYPYCTMRIADGKVYLFTGEHSPDDPKERGSPLACVDIEGNELWSIPFYASHWAANPAMADGYLVYMNAYDNRIYTFGKGPSAMTVEAPMTAVPKGTAVMITGTITDQSAGANGTPCISDEDMSAWMEYLYMQKPMPTDAAGVPVKLAYMLPDGTWKDIDETTSDIDGNFGYLWMPPDEGTYLVKAFFLGSESYGSSYATAYVGVGPAPEEPTEPATQPQVQADIDRAVDSLNPLFYGLIVAVVVAIVIGIVNLWAIRKRT